MYGRFQILVLIAWAHDDILEATTEPQNSAKIRMEGLIREQFVR